MTKTICAQATAPGVGGIAVIRLSGDSAFEIADTCFYGKVKTSSAKSHTIHYGDFKRDGVLIDKVTASVFVAPHSYTGENVVEISCHGGTIPAKQIVSALIKNGAELAEPGEFTKRAFQNGKLDLTQVEAVADLIHSISIPAAQTSARQLHGEFTSRMKNIRQNLIDLASLLEIELDFADEGLEFIERTKIQADLATIIDFCNKLRESFHSAEILREGFYVGIVGYPNSGKSTLFNALLQKERAIVSHIPGTTRDYLEESIIINRIPIKIIDTAGLRESEDLIEIEGIKLVQSVLKQSDLILVINDSSVAESNSNDLIAKLKAEFTHAKYVVVQNKIDLLTQANTDAFINSEAAVYISAKQKIAIDSLKDVIHSIAEASVNRVQDVLVNARHALLLEKTADILKTASEQITIGADSVLIAYDIRTAAKTLGEITGESWNQDVLNNIFSRFCIGK